MTGDFPHATLTANIIAALVMGLIIGIERSIGTLPPQTKLMLTTGLLGGLSTFSTFSMETVVMIEAGEYLRAGANVLLNVALCILFVFIGLYLSKLIPISR